MWLPEVFANWRVLGMLVLDLTLKYDIILIQGGLQTFFCFNFPLHSSKKNLSMSPIQWW